MMTIENLKQKHDEIKTQLDQHRHDAQARQNAKCNNEADTHKEGELSRQYMQVVIDAYKIVRDAMQRADINAYSKIVSIDKYPAYTAQARRLVNAAFDEVTG